MSSLEQVLVAATKGQPYLELINGNIISMYCDDVDFGKLFTQLEMLKTIVPHEMQNFSQFLKWFTGKQSNIFLLDQIKQVVRLILVLPATNAISERSFSTLRRVKTYLRSTMTQTRLNSLMKLTIYKEQTAQLDTDEIITAFIGNSARRAERLGM